MGDQIWGLTQSGLGPTFPIPVYDSSSAFDATTTPIAMVTLTAPGPPVGGLQALHGVSLGDSVYLITNGQFVFRATNFLQTAATPNLSPGAFIIELFNTGLATDGHALYAVIGIAGASSPSVSSAILELDPVTLAIRRQAPFGPRAVGLNAAPNEPVYANGSVYVGLQTLGISVTNSVYVIDTTTFAATVIPVASNVVSCTASPDGSKVYAFGSNSVYVIDTNTNAIVNTVSLPGVGWGALSPDGSRLWVPTHALSVNNVVELDTATMTVLHTVPSNLGNAIVVTSDDRAAFVADSSIKINTSTLAVTNVFNPGLGVLGILDVPAVRPKIPPPTRQKPRDDNLALGAPRQRVGASQPSSRQSSYRQGIKGTYS
jgi:YVTN family beta-propeller protein